MSTPADCRKWTITLTNYGQGWEWRAEAADGFYNLFGSDRPPGGLPALTKWGARRQAKRAIRRRFPKPEKDMKLYTKKTRKYEVCL